MKILELDKIEKTFFSHRDISRALGISDDSARVVAHRYVKKDILVRVKPNLFMLAEAWKHSAVEVRFRAANYLQVPSYISLTTALEYHGITTQMQRDYIESICTTRTLSRQIRDVTFRYTKLKPALYYGFEKRNDFYMAIPEKAILDAAYLASLGRYSLDVAALDKSKLDQNVLIELSGPFTDRTKQILRDYGFTGQA